MMWHDGIDVQSVCLLEGAEQDQAESMLIESMESGSHYAAMGLREMKSQRAIPVMKQLMKKADSDLKIQIAAALNVIEGTDEYTPSLIQVLCYNRSPYLRLNAAIALRNFPTNDTIQALFESVSTDPDYLVRFHASESLLHIHGLEPIISEHKEIFQLICVEFGPKDEAAYHEAIKHYTHAADMLRDLFKKK